jgi:glyoxylase-like metal-dependent hydrolase (beta-lactamase superfamily II)
MRIHTIDLLYQGHPGLIASYALETKDGITLIETGPSSCHTALLAGLQKIGAQPKDVRKVFLTHIHLDHSGAAGWWAQQAATVYVHSQGAAHLIDPSKLIHSASQIYGTRMEQLWGPIHPAPAEKVRPLTEGSTISLGDTELTAWDTPGHARHHLIYTLGDICFTGDQAGMLYPGTSYLSVTSAPPQFEPPAYISSVQRMIDANFRHMYLTHFGLITDVRQHLSHYQQLLRTAQEHVTAWVKEGLTTEQIHSRYQQQEDHRATTQGVSPSTWQLLQLANSTQMCSAGIERWVRKQLHPATPAPLAQVASE